jgi:hypothetical protein
MPNPSKAHLTLRLKESDAKLITTCAETARLRDTVRVQNERLTRFEALLQLKCRHEVALDEACATCEVSYMAEKGERCVVFDAAGVCLEMKGLRAPAPLAP